MRRSGFWPYVIACVFSLLSPIAASRAATLPFDRTSPVIYDNDGAVESGYTDFYIMALASAGVINLRGIITTGTYGEQPPFVPRSEEYLLLERRELVAKARRSGMRNIPDPTPGPGVSLSSRRPASGVIEHTSPVGAKGSWLIVNEARQATPSRPLVVVMGGQGSALADAYLLDNSIADNVVAVWLVGGKRDSNGILHGFEYNAYTDSWATHIIFERLRVVAFPVEDEEHVPYTPKSQFAQLPDTEIRQYLLENRWPRGTTFSEPSHNWDGLGALALTRPDIVASTKQIAFDHWEADIWGGPYPIPVWREDPSGRVIMVSRLDAALATQEWWSQVMNPAIWGTAAGVVPFSGSPSPVPGTIEAEHFDHGGTNLAYFDKTNNWTYEAWFNPFRFLEHVDIRSSSSASGGYFVTAAQAGEWLRYTVTAATAGTYSVEVKVASNGSGGTFHVEFNGIDRTGPMTVPNTGGAWTVLTKAGITLGAGPQVIRLVMDRDGASGQVGDFDSLRLIVSEATALVTITDGVVAPSYTLSASPATVAPGAVITIDWLVASSAPRDWIGLYPLGSSTRAYDPSRWFYTGGALRGTRTLTVPALAGAYEFRYLLNDGFNAVAASGPIMVSMPAPPPETLNNQDLPPVGLSLVVAPDTVLPGTTISATWSGLSNPTVRDWIALAPVGSASGSYGAWTYVSCKKAPTVARVSGSCSMTVPGNIASGNYEVRLFANDGFNLIVRSNTIRVGESPQGPVVGLNATTVTRGNVIPVNWSGVARPTPTDWLALYATGANASVYWYWTYASCSPTPTIALAAGSCSLLVPASVPAGSYEVRLLAEDGFNLIATSPRLTVQ